MDTKELLQLAAKACGIEILAHADGRSPVIRNGNGKRMWNPATDQADSDCIGTKLRINVEWCEQGVFCTVFGKADCCERYADHNGDENAALRAARLRCAAEIGKGMES